MNYKVFFYNKLGNMSKVKVDLFEGALYEGLRGKDFKDLIISLLKTGKLKDKYIEILTSEKSMETYGFAFTADSLANPEKNYECYEQMGDRAASHFMVSYFFRRFPILECSEGNKVVAKLIINYGAKKSFSSIAAELGFWKFITCPENGNIPKKKYRNTHMKELLEDVLEAFLGCTEKLLDEAFRHGVGYAIVYDILSNIFDKISISLEYEDLVDAKSRLKETFDLNWISEEIGEIVYVNTLENKETEDGRIISMHRCKIYRAPPGVSADVPKTPKNIHDVMINPHPPPWIFDLKERRYHNPYWELLAEARSVSKSESEQTAAELGIKKLKEIGVVNRHGYLKKYFKEPPPEYEFFCRK